MEDFITVTVISSILKEEVQDRLTQFNDGVSNKKKDSLGRTAEFYLELGIKVPEELQSDDDELFFDIKKEHYKTVEKPGKIRPTIIDFMVDNEDLGSTLYVSTDYTITVKETVEEIESKIKLLKNGVK